MNLVNNIPKQIKMVLYGIGSLFIGKQMRKLNDGTYPLCHIECGADISEIINQLRTIKDDNIDSKFIIAELLEMYDGPDYTDKKLNYFLKISKKIKIGKDMQYKGQPEKLIKCLKLMYPAYADKIIQN